MKRNTFCLIFSHVIFVTLLSITCERMRRNYKHTQSHLVINSCKLEILTNTADGVY